MVPIPFPKPAFFLILIMLLGSCQKTENQEHNRSITSEENHSADFNRIESMLAISKSAFRQQQPATGTTLDKSQRFATEALALSKQFDYKKGIAESYLQLAVIMQEKTNYQKGKAYAGLAVNAFQKVNEPEQLGEAWVMYWSTNVLTGMPYEQRPALLQKAANAFRKAGNKKREADCYKEMGDIYQLCGEGGKALKVVKMALALYEESGYKELCFLYDVIGATYCYLGAYKEAIEYEFKAEKSAIAFGEQKFLCTVYNRIGLAYMEINDVDNGIKYYQKSLAVAVKFQDIPSISMLVENYAAALLKKNRSREALVMMNTYSEKYPVMLQPASLYFDCTMISIYNSLGKYETAKRYIPSVKQKLQQADTYDDILMGYHVLLNDYLRDRDFENYEKYLALYRTMCKRLNKTIYNAEYYYFGYMKDSVQGNCDSALHNFRQYVQLRRQNFNSVKAHEIDKLSILYETEKKDKDISLLKNEAIDQKNKLERAALTRNIMYGTLFFLAIIIFLLYKGFMIKIKSNKALKIKQDEIALKNDSLEKVIKEKEWLLREIHHRVKNNLHMVVGLLVSQTEFLKGKEAVDAISESQRRVEAMAMIHQKLYQSENLSMIDMPSYIDELTSYLKDSFNNESIRFALDIEKIQFPISHSIPVGLILNEAITNALKYAFPDHRKGVIKIILKKYNPDSFLLTIWDNGIGLPADFDLQNTNTLGLRLLQGLSDDIQASIAITTDNGTKITIDFDIPDWNATENAIN